MNRSRMTVRVVPLTSREAGDARVGGTIEQRLAAIDALTAEAWRLAGRPLPAYTREAIPIYVRHLAEQTPST